MLHSKTGRKASVKGVFALVFYLIIPTIAIYFIVNTYPELGGARYKYMVYWFIPLSLMLVIVSQLSIRYPKGDKRRFALNISYVLITLIWLLAFLGGNLVIRDSWGGFEFALHLWRYILLIIAVASFNIFYYALEWQIHKNDAEVGKTGGNGSVELIPFLGDD